jgi:hypothetical protein
VRVVALDAAGGGRFGATVRLRRLGGPQRADAPWTDRGI